MEKKIFENRKKYRSKAELKPIAQTNSLCDGESIGFGSYEWSVLTEQKISKVCKELAMLFVFQYESGCRISECLQASYENITRTGSIKIVGNKGSKTRIVECSRIADYLIKCKRNKKNPFDLFNRFFIHRQYVKFGIIFQSEKSKKKSTTHALRQLKAESIRQITDESELISDSLGQKNVRNSQFYGNAKKQK
jgi:integrase